MGNQGENPCLMHLWEGAGKIRQNNNKGAMQWQIPHQGICNIFQTLRPLEASKIHHDLNLTLTSQLQCSFTTGLSTPYNPEYMTFLASRTTRNINRSMWHIFRYIISYPTHVPRSNACPVKIWLLSIVVSRPNSVFLHSFTPWPN